MNYFSSDFRLGILGGGQLGKMLLTDTRKFDIQTFVLEEFCLTHLRRVLLSPSVNTRRSCIESNAWARK